MTYEEFQHLARLSIVGSLDEDESELFCAGRLEFGSRAESFIAECRKLNLIFALSLRPMPPNSATKEKLLARIRALPKKNSGDDRDEPETPFRAFLGHERFRVDARYPGSQEF